MTLLDRIKRKGLGGGVKAIFVKSLTFVMLGFYNLFPIDETLIVLDSEGDCTDNAYGIYDNMRENGYLTKYKIVWLNAHPENFKDENNVKHVKKFLDPDFQNETIKALKTCKFYIYDHGNVLTKHKRKGQTVINLTHGASFKAPKGTARGQKYYADETYALSPFFYNATAEFNDCPMDKIYDMGFPRLDFLFKPISQNTAKLLDDLGFNKYKTFFLWMPTFRKSGDADISEDYFASETGLPVLYTENELAEFNGFLNKNNAVCVFKMHHLQAAEACFNKTYSNILTVTDEILKKASVQLYEFIKCSSSLITDYSSVSADYMLLNRPIIYTLDDYEDYKRSRGFCFPDPIKYFPGDHVYTKNELFESISDVCEGKDKHKEERNKLVPIMHSHADGNAAKRILDRLNITP